MLLMEKKNFTKNDCFLIKGRDINEPMIIYQITDIDEIHIWAKNISIKNEIIDGFPVSEMYDEAIPDIAIRLPSDSWRWAKNQMLSFVKETFTYLRENVIKEKVDIVIGGHYLLNSSEITTVKEIGEERIKTNVFKIDEDYISPYFTGDCPNNNAYLWYAISDENYNELISKYNKLLSKLRNKFYVI